MRTNRHWFFGSAILLLLPLIFAVYAKGDGDRDRDREETTYRWDIVHITSFSPNSIVFEGGFASALANDGSKITVTGEGTFEPGEPEEVTGGGAWTTFASNGTTVTGTGSYRVTQLIRFEVAPGFQTNTTVDNIPGAKGDLSDIRGGLLFAKIAYSDGSKGVLVVSCHLNGNPPPQGPDATPANVFEGISASKDYVDYWNRVAPIGAPSPVDGNRTLFHVFERERRDRN